MAKDKRSRYDFSADILQVQVLPPAPFLWDVAQLEGSASMTNVAGSTPAIPTIKSAMAKSAQALKGSIPFIEIRLWRRQLFALFDSGADSI